MIKNIFRNLFDKISSLQTQVFNNDTDIATNASNIATNAGQRVKSVVFKLPAFNLVDLAPKVIDIGDTVEKVYSWKYTTLTGDELSPDLEVESVSASPENTEIQLISSASPTPIDPGFLLVHYGVDLTETPIP